MIAFALVRLIIEYQCCSNFEFHSDCDDGYSTDFHFLLLVVVVTGTVMKSLLIPGTLSSTLETWRIASTWLQMVRYERAPQTALGYVVDWWSKGLIVG